MERKVDVLVVGAGIAGLVCSLKLVREGYKVLIIDQLKRIGGQNQRKIDITEGANLDSVFGELNLPLYGEFDRSFWYSKKEFFELKSKVHDYYILRGPDEDSFDVGVANQCLNLGVDISLNTQLKGFALRGNFIESVTVAKNGFTEFITPKIVVGSDGHNSICAKLSGLESSVKEGVELIGYGEMCTNIDAPEGETHILFNTEYCPGGYFYIGQTKGEGLFSIVVEKKKQIGSIASMCKKGKAEIPVLKKIMRDYAKKSFFVGSGKTGIMRKRSKGNLLLAGDAARTMDPVFGYGVRQAILSGYISANLINEKLSLSITNLEEYDKILRRQLLKDEWVGHKVRNIFDKMTNDDIDFVFRSINNLHINHDLDIILENPSDHIFPILKELSKNPSFFLKVIKLSVLT